MNSACVASVLGLSFRIELFEGTDKTWNGYRVEIAAYASIIPNTCILIGDCSNNGLQGCRDQHCHYGCLHARLCYVL